jgi:hypothetical protein
MKKQVTDLVDMWSATHFSLTRLMLQNSSSSSKFEKYFLDFQNLSIGVVLSALLTYSLFLFSFLLRLIFIWETR